MQRNCYLALRKLLFVIAVCFFISIELLNVYAVDLTVSGGDLRTVVQQVARSENIDIVGTESLKGTLDINLKNIDAIEAIKKIGQLKGFNVIVDQHKVYIIGKSDENMQTIAVKPSYLRPEALKKALEVVVPADRMQAINENNLVLVRGNINELAQLQQIMEFIDIAPQQVQLDVYVMALQRSELKESGIGWNYLFGSGKNSEENNDYIGIKTGIISDGAAYSLLIKPNLYANDKNANNKLIAHPNMVAMNGQKASILIGDKVPTIENTSDNNVNKTSVKYVDTGIKLTYEPNITPNGEIDTILEAEVSTPHIVPELKAYRITTRQANTRVRVKNGEYLVIGGLMDSRNEHVEERVPLLSKIPILGNLLFTHKDKRQEDTELIILIRANILK